MIKQILGSLLFVASLSGCAFKDDSESSAADTTPAAGSVGQAPAAPEVAVVAASGGTATVPTPAPTPSLLGEGSSCVGDSECAGVLICDFTRHICMSPSSGLPSGSGGSPGTAPANAGTGNVPATGGTAPVDVQPSGGTFALGGSPPEVIVPSLGGTPGSAGSGGSSQPVASDTLIATFKAWDTFPNFLFTDVSVTPGSNFFFPNQACEASSGDTRKCTMVVDPSLTWDFVASTGFLGAGSWTPGLDGGTNKCTAYMQVTLTRFDGQSFQNVNFHMVSDGNGGCHFRIEPYGALANLDKANEDSDSDGVLNGDDCDKGNPSIDTCDNGNSGGNPVGNPVNATTKTLVFDSFDAESWGNPLELHVLSGTYRKVGCQPLQLKDPQGGYATLDAVRCFVEVDRSQDFEYVVHTGSKWLVGDNGNNGCQQWFREYVYESSGNAFFPLADLDSSNVTNFPERNMRPKYISPQDGCHVVLPKAQ